MKPLLADNGTWLLRREDVAEIRITRRDEWTVWSDGPKAGKGSPFKILAGGRWRRVYDLVDGSSYVLCKGQRLYLDGQTMGELVSIWRGEDPKLPPVAYVMTSEHITGKRMPDLESDAIREFEAFPYSAKLYRVDTRNIDRNTLDHWFDLVLESGADFQIIRQKEISK